MLKRDLLITLHLRIRVVATQDLKMRVKMARERSWKEKVKGGGGSGKAGRHRGLDEDRGVLIEGAKKSPHNGMAWLSMSPKSARKHTRRAPSTESDPSNVDGSVEGDGEEDVADDDYIDEDEEDDDSESDGEASDIDWDAPENIMPSMISDPGSANPLQRRWLSSMSEGKDTQIARRFER
jgi:nitrogen permease regulator 3-like protein